MKVTESNRLKSLWQHNHGSKPLLCFLFLFRDLFPQVPPHKILTLPSSCSSYWCYIKRCCSCWCCSCSHSLFSSTPHLFLSSDCHSLPKFSSTSLGKKITAKTSAEVFFRLFPLGTFCWQSQKNNRKPSYFPRDHMLPELMALFLCLSPPKGRADLPSSF